MWPLTALGAPAYLVKLLSKQVVLHHPVVRKWVPMLRGVVRGGRGWDPALGHLEGGQELRRLLHKGPGPTSPEVAQSRPTWTVVPLEGASGGVQRTSS